MIMQKIDIDGDGTLDFDEFLLIMINKMAESRENEDNEEDLINQMKCFDHKNDGTISSTELKMVMNALGEYLNPEEVEGMIKEA